VAGALYGGLRVTVSPNDFVFLQSLSVFLVACFGGLTTVAGALFGGAFLALAPELQKHVRVENIQLLLIGVGAIWLAGNPNGFGGQVSDAGTAIRQAVDERRRRRQAGPARAPVAAGGDRPVEKVGAR